MRKQRELSEINLVILGISITLSNVHCYRDCRYIFCTVCYDT